MSVDPSPAPRAETPEAASSTPATTADTALDTSGLSPEVAQALQAAYGHLGAEEPAEPVIPAEQTAAEVAPEPAVSAADAGDEDDEPEETSAETEATPGEPKLSRRQRAEQRQQEAIDAAVARALTAENERKVAEAALAASRAAEQELAATVAGYIGAPADEEALIDAIANGDAEDPDDNWTKPSAKLKALRENRKVAEKLFAFGRQKVFGELFEKIQSVKGYPGVDAKVIDGVTDLTQVFEHVRDATAKAIEATWSDRLERQKADYESRLSSSAQALPTTETGGRAVGAPQITRADLERLYRSGDWKEYQRLEAEFDRLAAAGQLR